MSEDLTTGQEKELEAALRELTAHLSKLLDATSGDAKPVDLDQPIGRLSRMDAMQQQQMAKAARRNHELKRTQVLAALAALEAGEYGECRRCEEPIGYARLAARPETPFCLSCQSNQER